MLRPILIPALLVTAGSALGCGESEERAVPSPPEPDASSSTATPVRTVSEEKVDRADDLRTLARRWARKRGLDPAFLQALIAVESGWNPEAVSPDGARGLTQIMPGTAREEFGLMDPSRLLNPETNLRLGTAHLRALFEEFCSPRLALWAWHAGPERVDAGAARITPAESRRFVRRVLRRYRGREDEGTRAADVTYPKADCPEPARVAHVSEPDTALEPDATEATSARVVGPPVADVTHARLSSRRVRVGEPVNLRIEAANRGGEAESGEIAVALRQHPEVRLGYRTDLTATFRSQGRVSLDDNSEFGEGVPVVRARTSSWKHTESHWLYVRLVPQATGRIVLAYRVRLEGDGYGFGGTDADEAGRTVAIEVTETLAGGTR